MENGKTSKKRQEETVQKSRSPIAEEAREEQKTKLCEGTEIETKS